MRSWNHEATLLRLVIGATALVVSSEASSQVGSRTGRWEGQIGVLVPIGKSFSSPDVVARLQPTLSVSLGARMGETRSAWGARGQLAIATGHRITPTSQCGVSCTVSSGREGVVAVGMIENRVLGQPSGPRLRFGAGVRALLYPGLGSSCSPGDRPCSTLRTLSERSVRPAGAVGVTLPLGGLLDLDASTVVSRLDGGRQVDLFLSGGRRFGK